MQPAPPDLIDIPAAAADLGVNPTSLRVWAHRDKLTSYGRRERRTLWSYGDLAACAARRSAGSLTKPPAVV